jgi:hypothetical protein
MPLHVHMGAAKDVGEAAARSKLISARELHLMEDLPDGEGGQKVIMYMFCGVAATDRAQLDPTISTKSF